MLFYTNRDTKNCQNTCIFIICIKYFRLICHNITKAGTDVGKNASKLVVWKTAEATREFIGNKIDEKIVKSKLEPDLSLRNVEEIINLPEKR